MTVVSWKGRFLKWVMILDLIILHVPILHVWHGCSNPACSNLANCQSSSFKSSFWCCGCQDVWVSIQCLLVTAKGELSCMVNIPFFEEMNTQNVWLKFFLSLFSSIFSLLSYLFTIHLCICFFLFFL